MTNKNFFESITLGTTITEEQAQKAQELLASLLKSEANRAEKRAEKKSADLPLIKKVVEFLHTKESATASEIAEAIGVTTSKATVLAKQVEGVVIGEGRNGNRVVKTYSLK